MQPNLTPIQPELGPKKFYISVHKKFWISHLVSIGWLIFSVYLSIPWLRDFSSISSFPVALIVICGIAYIPGYMNAFLVISLLLDRQPKISNRFPKDPVTLLIAAFNEEDSIFNTLKYVANQDYLKKMHVIVINNNSSDNTDSEIKRASKEFGLTIKILHEAKPGKFHALNKGLTYVTTPYVITLDADTLLHPSAVRFLVSKIKNSPNNVCAVAGSMLVRNSRETLWTRIQEWDYFLGIASIKRLQGLYQGTLVAQGAFSLYKTECVRAVHGWPNAIGEDIVLTWRLLQKNWKVYFEPLAIAFTDTPTSLKQFAKQRSRWARGMIEGLTEIKPWHQPQLFTKYLTGINFIMPYLDLVYTLCWIPGLILAFFGIYWVVGLMTLLVLPLTFISYGLLYFYQKHFVFNQLNLRVRKNPLGFILFLFFYQLIMSPVSVWGYFQEFFKRERVW
ncbi:glycosyltransferase [Sporolactobacillus spathodeae]|uniref:Biofilm PGA synthesis N-glycosyltransferase PgaC n=1 Tax=Sporolactobacillus spathodeae TaxID=1465502 RepID=A0ABS2QAT4_9BACL|nr:glycosyltransferase [Sporolactobacillus spathodeae]MBM7658912.1 biofilm PGA synthesis N-glycosyltransferase PgaC [Sporolactobacillus spathodeae]